MPLRGLSWNPLGSLLAGLGRSRAALGRSWGVLGPLLGALLDRSWSFLGSLGVISGILGAVLALPITFTAGLGGSHHCKPSPQNIVLTSTYLNHIDFLSLSVKKTAQIR